MAVLSDRIHLVPPRLVLVMGVAGTGKTTFAKALLGGLCAVYLDNNFVADAFFPDTRSDEPYLRIRNSLYAALYRIAGENLIVGNTILLDAPHVKEMQNADWRAWISEFAARNGARLRIIRCYTSEETLRERIQTRGEPRDQWKLDNWESFLASQPLRASIPFDHLDVATDCGETLDHVAQAIPWL